MKYIRLITGLLLVGSLAQAIDCDILQVSSKDNQTNHTRLGNAFAYTGKTLIVNDHTLMADATSVQLQQGSKVWTAQVLKRDFHTDLAVLVVQDGNFKPCSLRNEKASSVQVIGYDQKDKGLSTVQASVKTEASTKLMVPGILKSLEIVASGQSELRSSQSGSILMGQTGVVGMITQKTSEGTALAISSQDLDKTARMMLENRLPKRNYEVDRRNGTFKFDGLVLPKQDIKFKGGVGGVDPHGRRNDEGNKVDPHGRKKQEESKIDPHGRVHNPYTSDKNAPQPIALEDYDVGAVLATVEDFTMLENKQPKLFKALREAQAKRVFISSVDGIKIKNLFELLRVLGDCQNCIIDSFWVEVKDPSEVQDSSLKLMGWFSALIVELEENNKAAVVRDIVNSIQAINPKLVKLINDGNSGRMDLNTKAEVKAQWNMIETKLDKMWHSERGLDILTEIRKEIL